MKMKFISPLVLTVLLAVACSDDKDDKQLLFSGNDITDSASIERDKSTKKTTLKLDINGGWSLYAGPSAEEIDFNQPILTGNKKGEYEVDVANDKRSYFQLVTTEGKAILAERCLPVNNYHFRDMGGYKTTDGRFVRWGKVFRSDEFVSITDDDVHYLNSLPLRSIVDFRSVEEAQKNGNKHPASVKNVYDLNISIGDLVGLLTEMGPALFTISREEIINIMSDLYRDFVTEEECVDVYKKFFEVLQNEENLPLVYNCTIGKDRTGIASLLFLSSLGVSEKVILADYQLTDAYHVKEKYQDVIHMIPAVAPLFEANPDYLKAAIDQIEKEHGSVENFLTKVLKVDLQKMRRIYLY